MTFQQELRSWMSPTAITTSPAPEVGVKAPSSSKLLMPNANGKPTVVLFLRHCGCPFAEKSFKDLRNYANKNKDVNFVAVSHSDLEATEKWVIAVGGEWEAKVIVDSDRETYAQWGLGVSSAWHVLSPWSMYSVYKLGKQDGIWNKPTESGSRWQTSGSFAVDGNGVVKWARISKTADDLPDFREALNSIGFGI
ncbi:hypothetical protein D0Z07_6235 [Hyphodiscus hymeniophilus]|uniref:Thioredoxin domain-containing protein n=1 Tax=Hyphodiscus hymeniophilus TaxID=353542 RepID=A0A9P7AUK2_9HELO|nr:hypothetical protein D0Z07_6235 [Hyphodiscus hymeniophilus]